MGKVNKSITIKNYSEKFPSGKTKVKGKLINCNKDGEWVEYYSSGKIRRIINYKEGRKHGKSYEYKENGELGISLDYFNGRLIYVSKNL